MNLVLAVCTKSKRTDENNDSNVLPFGNLYRENLLSTVDGISSRSIYLFLLRLARFENYFPHSSSTCGRGKVVSDEAVVFERGDRRLNGNNVVGRLKVVKGLQMVEELQIWEKIQVCEGLQV